MKYFLRNSQLRQIIRETLIHELNDPDENWSKIPKNDWAMLQTNDPRRDEVKEELFQLVQQSYFPMGGHTKIKSADDLDRYKYWMVKDIDDDPGIDVAMMGKPDVGGNKMAGGATDGTGPAKSAYKDKSAELRSGGSIGGTANWWGEVSGPIAAALIKRGAPAVEDEGLANKLLAGDHIEWLGNYPGDLPKDEIYRSVKGWYKKKFSDGTAHTKIIMGKPKG